jgi:hypothetical protein
VPYLHTESHKHSVQQHQCCATSSLHVFMTTTINVNDSIECACAVKDLPWVACSEVPGTESFNSLNIIS